MADSHTILWHVEKAAQQYVRANLPAWLPETQIYRGTENRDTEAMEGQESSLKIRPCVVCSCVNASSSLQNWNGIWTPVLSVEVEANRAQTDGDLADQQASEIFDLFIAENVLAGLREQIDGFMVRAVIPRDVVRQAIGRAWISIMTFGLEGCTRQPLI